MVAGPAHDALHQVAVGASDVEERPVAVDLFGDRASCGFPASLIASKARLGTRVIARWFTEHGRLVGSIGLRLGEGESGSVGCWRAREARGRGITTRALGRLCRYALEDLSLERLELTTDVENPASQRVAEKVGFRREGVLRSHLPPSRWLSARLGSPC